MLAEGLVCAGAGLGWYFTIGVTADCGVAVAGAGSGAAAEAAAAVVRVAAVRVTARLATGVGLAAVVRAVRLTVRVDRVVVSVDVSVVGATALVSALGAVSGTGVAGAGSVTGEVGWTVSWASPWVDESARAAAIAGKARVRAWCRLDRVVMTDQPAWRTASRAIIGCSTSNADESNLIAGASSMRVALFSYGTLQQRDVQLATYGRELEGSPDALAGHVLAPLVIDDPHVVDVSGKEVHTIARPSGSPEDRIAGVVFQLSEEELAATDAYETSAYTRVELALESGRMAYVYVGPPLGAG